MMRFSIGRRFRQRFLHLPAYVLVVHANDRLHLRAIGTVDDVLLRQLQRRGDDGGAQLAQRHGAHPVFPATAQDHHDHVPLADAELAKRVGRPVRQLRQVVEREGALSSRSSHHTSARFSGSTRAHSSTTSKPKLNASGTSILKFSKKSSYESNSMRGQYFFRIWFTGCASYSAMIVTNFAGTSPPQRWPCGCSGLK